MHDDAATAEVVGLLRRAASALPVDAPPPGEALRLLFAAGLPAAAAEVDRRAGPLAPPTPTRRFSMIRTSFATLPAKLALAAAGLTFATTGLAAANALPGPVQQVAADLADVVGVDVPVPGDTTPPTDGTVTPPTDGTVTPPTDGTVTPPTDGTVTPPTDGTVTPPTDGTVTPPTDETPELPAPATSARQAAHVHAFDEACGNHGAYVSFVARNGTEPPCATAVRNGAPATPPTTTTPDTGTEQDETAEPGKPAKPVRERGGDRGASAAKGGGKKG